MIVRSLFLKSTYFELFERNANIEYFNILASTVDQNIIENKFKYSFSNISIEILNFSLLLPISYRSSKFAIAKVVALNLFAPFSFIRFVDRFMASFLYCFPSNYRSSNYCDSNSHRSFTLLKALAKSNGNIFAIASKSEKE